MAARPGVALSAQPPVAWPPDDTEESVVGTDFHQLTITNLRLGINELAALRTPPGGPVPWQASGQIIFGGFRRPDGSRYQVLPDVFVCRRAFDIRRKSLSTTLDGPPLLIVEVLSDATYEGDLDLGAGKGYSYANAGVGEYLALDPTGEYLPEGGGAGGSRAARTGPGRRSRRGAGGAGRSRWRSGWRGPWWPSIPRMAGRLLREGEIERGLAAKDRQHAEELARQEAELASLRRRWVNSSGASRAARPCSTLRRRTAITVVSYSSS